MKKFAASKEKVNTRLIQQRIFILFQALLSVALKRDATQLSFRWP